MPYARGMKQCAFRSATVLGLAIAALAGAATAAAAAETSLLEACFQAASLPVRPGESHPVKDAPGARATIPRQALAPFSPVPESLRGVIRHVELPPGRKLIALTFDMCEQFGEVAGYDGAIIDYLRANRIKATIFAGGKWLVSHGERARQLIADPLLEIGNHGWVHRNTRGLTGRDLVDEITGPQRAFEATRASLAGSACAAAQPKAMSRTPQRLGLYRFPYGACNPESLRVVAEQGLLAIQWDLSTGDPAPSQSARQIANAMVHNAKPGAIIIAHANGRGYHTAEALPLALPALRAKGFEFVTVSELLAAGRPVIAQTCYDARPGDTDRYDFLFARRTPSAQPTTRTSPHGWTVHAVPN